MGSGKYGYVKYFGVKLNAHGLCVYNNLHDP